MPCAGVGSPASPLNQARTYPFGARDGGGPKIGQVGQSALRTMQNARPAGAMHLATPVVQIAIVRDGLGVTATRITARKAVGVAYDALGP
jgi:hypothetical protein